MTEYLRRAGSTFSRALSALGVWCTGVTSENANIRSDMYKQLVAQIRGTSPHLRHAAESILQAHVHGMWVQLVDDFSMQREEYSPQDMILYVLFRLLFMVDMKMLRNLLALSFQITDFWKDWMFWMYKVLFWRL